MHKRRVGHVFLTPNSLSVHNRPPAALALACGLLACGLLLCGLLRGLLRGRLICLLLLWLLCCLPCLPQPLQHPPVSAPVQILLQQCCLLPRVCCLLPHKLKSRPLHQVLGEAANTSLRHKRLDLEFARRTCRGRDTGGRGGAAGRGRGAANGRSGWAGEGG